MPIEAVGTYNPGTDIINASMAKMGPQIEKMFLSATITLDQMAKLKTEDLKSTEEQFLLSYGDEGVSTVISGIGDQLVLSSNTDGSVYGKIRSNRIKHAFNLTQYQVDLANLNKETGAAELLAQRLPRAIQTLSTRLNNQLARGVSGLAAGHIDRTKYSGFFTLNGDQTYNPMGMGAWNGLLRFQSPAAQESAVITRLGIVANVEQGWYNFYDHINSMSGDGIRVMDTLLQEMGRTNLDNKYPTVWISDAASARNWVAMQTNVLTYNDDKKTDSPFTFRDSGHVYQPRPGVAWTYDDAIDVTDTAAFTTANAQLGVIYMLDLSKFKVRTVPVNTKMVNLTPPGSTKKGPWFHMHPCWFDEDRGIHVFSMSVDFGVQCNSLRHQAVLTGGAVE